MVSESHYECRQTFCLVITAHYTSSQSFYLVTAYHNVANRSHNMKLSLQIIGCAYPITRLYTCLMVNTTHFVYIKRHMVCCKKYVMTTSTKLYQQSVAVIAV